MNKQKEILRISKKLGLSHIGSCLSVLPILEEIYAIKKPKDKVILDGAHSHLSHLLFTNPTKAEALIKKHGIHCDRKAGCDASGGSLGHGLGISIGYALANPKITIYCIMTDGGMMEGSNWEALRLVTTLGLKNIEIYVNANGYSAVARVAPKFLKERMQVFHDIHFRLTDNTKEFAGISGHYKKL